MKLYEIDQALEEALSTITVDEDTGEVICDMEAVEQLGLAREEKIEGILLHMKNETAEAEAIKAEEAALAKRRQAIEKKVKRTKEWLQGYLDGEKFKTARVSVTYRNTTKTEVGPGFIVWAAANRPELLRVKAPEPDKTAIGQLLKAGQEIHDCQLVETVSMTIK